jgi:purine-cytosine permease-like protein
MILQQQANKDEMQGISSILIKAKVRGGPTVDGNGVPSILIEILLVPRKYVLLTYHPYLSCSRFLAFSSLGSACFSPIACVCLAHFSRLLVSSLCVLFPHHPCLSCSCFLAFLSLGSVCFSPITCVCCAHFFLPSRP